MIPQGQSLALFIPLCVCGNPYCIFPFGICHCGCGRETGYRRGKRLTYIHGHNAVKVRDIYICICGNLNCPIPFGLCHCGCMGRTPIADRNRVDRGRIKGRPTKYVRGHGPGRTGVPPLMDGQCACRNEDCAIPYGTCHCGCGGQTKISLHSCVKRRTVAGSPRLYIKGHRAIRHGHTSKNKNGKSPTYSTWRGMISRCVDKNHRAYKNYGGRGVTICERWMVFENFLADMGERPVDKTLERLNVDGNYEPANCKWATNIEQQNNRRNTPSVYYNGKKYTLVELSEMFGIKKNTLNRRLKWYRMTIEEALRTPVRTGVSFSHR